MSCQYQKEKAPKAVKENFKIKYSNENGLDWEKDKNGNFKASFKKEGKYFRVDFSSNGNWIETERTIDKKDLPELIQNILVKEFDTYKIV